MLLVSDIKENKAAYVEAMKKRNIQAETMFDDIIALDDKRRTAQLALDNTLAESNAMAKEIGGLFKAGKAEEGNALKEKTGELKQKSKELSETLAHASDKLQELLFILPNIPHDLVPHGDSDEDNEEIFSEGNIPTLSNNALPHWELAKKYDLIDFELGTKVTGAGFPVYKGKGARLQRALIAYFLDKNVDKGYTEYQVPHLVNEASGIGTGSLPDKEGQMYHVGVDDLYLIPTAEVPVTNLFRGDLVNESELPILCTAYTPCFRREAGSYGAHVRGLNRLHQFDKVEIVRIETPKNSHTALETMVEHVKEILRELGLPFRVLRLCGGDLTFASALTYDFEVFSAAQERWLEVSSVSNFEAFQSNRLKLRYKSAEGKKQLAHTLNGSALALPRILASILENYQTNEGIRIPEVLIPYTGFKEIE